MSSVNQKPANQQNDFQKYLQVFLKEVLGNLIGYIAGISSYSIVSMYFVEKSAFNLWGALSFKRTAVDGSTYEFLNVFIAGVIGFAAMKLFDYLGTQLYYYWYPTKKQNNG